MRTGFLFLLAGAMPVAAAPPTATPLESWSTVFGGSDVTLHFAVVGDEPFAGTAGWRLAANSRTLATGESRVTVEPGTPATVDVSLSLPDVKEGVVFPAVLSVRLFGNDRRSVANLDKELWICSDDAFAGREAWLARLKVRLFGPEGRTAKRFEESGIPFESVHNVDALDQAADGLVVVGEGVSFREHRGLPGILLGLAARGAAVLCLAPSGGELYLPGTTDGARQRPSALIFRRAGIIRELDKRLDVGGWPPDGCVASRSVKMRGDRGPVAIEIEEGQNGWLWVEAGFDDTGGKLVVCGFGIIEKWEASPTPRFLLAAMLEYLDREAEAKGDGQ